MKLSKFAAQSAYRAAWAQRCLSNNLDEQKAAERVMDAVQNQCVDGGKPGPEWEAFILTLPGYVEFWKRWYAQFGASSYDGDY